MYDSTRLHTQWHNSREVEGSIALTGKLHVKTGLPINLYFIFSILLVFGKLLPFCVFRSNFWF